MAAAAAVPAPRHLSDLPDDLLQRILFKAPAREAAATAVLSRRWRYLWRASGVAYLDSRCFIGRACPSPEEHGQSWGWNRPSFCDSCFLHAAEKVLAAATVPITRLTFIVAYDLRPQQDDHLVAAVVSHPAARSVEELHIEVDHRRSNRSLSFGSLPSQSLRVLRLINCSPQLAELRLHKCTVPLADLQHIVGAAPRLAALHLESSTLTGEEQPLHMPIQPPAIRCYRLVGPAVTAVVFADCTFRMQRRDKARIELDVPRLQSLRYRGHVQLCDRFSLKPNKPAAANMLMIQAELHSEDSYIYYDLGDRVPLPLFFWQFMQSFSTAKIIKLKLDFYMERIMESQDDKLPGRRVELFPNLERLELDAQYTPVCVESGLVLATFLHGCPAVRDLRLKLSKHWQQHSSMDKEARVDFDKSVDCFRRRRSSMRRSSGGDGVDDGNYEASDIPVLRDQSFSCLERCLRRVSLQFCMDNNPKYCHGVQLAKFFADNARALEEMHIDDGSQQMCEHMIFSKTRLVRSRGPSIEA